MAESLGECCPNFDTPALFKRRGNAAQVLTFILWLGHSLEHPKVAKSHQNPPKIDPKSLKVGTWGGSWHPWAPPGGLLGTTWGPDAKTIKKVTWWTSPQEVPKEVIFEYLSILFRVPFLVPVLVPFLATFWVPWDLKK